MLTTINLLLIWVVSVIHTHTLRKLERELNIVKGQVYDLAVRTTKIETVKEAIK